MIMVVTNKLPFTLVYADEVKGHLRAIETKYHSLIEAEIEGQLLFEPEVVRSWGSHLFAAGGPV